MIQRIEALTSEIDSETREFGRGYLLILVALTLLALYSIISSERWIENGNAYYNSGLTSFHGLTLFPQVVAGGITIDNGLAAFSGKTPKYLPAALRTAMISSMLLEFVLFPTLYLFGWRERRLHKQVSYRGRTLRISSLIYGFCAVTTLFVAIVIFPVTPVQENVRHRVRQGQAVQTVRDAMITLINAVDTDLQQYRILPKRHGGGEGEYTGYVLPPSLAETPEATITVAANKDKAQIMLHSKIYPNTSVEVWTDTSWIHAPWIYTGEFR